ncbi:MAG: hypothetical protein ACOVJ8_02480 [Sediminibacterium sp.]
MRKIRSLILLLLLVNSASAHNPQVSTISIIQNENNKWSVFITAPLYTCQSAIQENYPSLKIDTLNALETQKLILNLVKTSFIINGDNNVKLINDKIQLAHETTLYFDIQSDKPNFSPSVVSFSAFSKLTNHFTLLKIVPNKGKEISYILNSDNGFNYPKIFKKEATPKKYLSFIKYILIVFVGFVLVMFLKKSI